MAAATGNGTAKVTLPTDEQILIEREFDAPKGLVDKAYTTPELVRRWWAGQRGEVTTCEIDLRVGGAWRYVMLAHGEFEVAFHGEYREVVPGERIVSTDVYEGAPNAEAITYRNVHRSRRAYDARDSRPAHHQGEPRRADQLRDGSRHERVAGPPRAGCDLPAVRRNSGIVDHREITCVGPRCSGTGSRAACRRAADEIPAETCPPCW